MLFKTKIPLMKSVLRSDQQYFTAIFFKRELSHTLTWAGGVLIVCGGLFLLKSRLHGNEPSSPAAT